MTTATRERTDADPATHAEQVAAKVVTVSEVIALCILALLGAVAFVVAVLVPLFVVLELLKDI